MSTKFGGNVDVCGVCKEKVYPTDRFAIEKTILHKNCFKCEHCDRKLGLGNFAAVNGMFYCKPHYMKLFRESGGKYDKAFGDAGFEKKTVPSYTPGQFQGIGKTPNKPSALPARLSNSPPQLSPELSPVVSLNKAKVADFMKHLEEASEDDTEEEVMKPKSSVKEMLTKYENSLTRDVSSSSLDESPQKPKVSKELLVDTTPGGSLKDRMEALKTAISKSEEEIDPKPISPPVVTTSNSFRRNENSSKSKLEIDETPGGTAEQRKQAYLAQISKLSSSNSPTERKQISKGISDRIKLFSSGNSPTTPPKQESPIGKIDDKLKTFIHAASGGEKTPPSEKEVGKIDDSKKTPFDYKKGETILEKLEVNDDGNRSPNALFSPTGSSDGHTIRSFNEGASAALRRTPSWLRQQKAVEDAIKAMEEQAKAKDIPPEQIEEIKQEPPKIEEEQVKEEEEEVVVEEEEVIEEPLPKTPPGSIMKRAGSWKKNSSDAPPSARTVRFGNAEIHSLPSSPQQSESSSPEPNIKSSSGHSARKGSALAAYLNVVDSNSRKRSLEPAGHSDSPPPPMLSPGAKSPPGVERTFTMLDAIQQPADNLEPKGEETQ